MLEACTAPGSFASCSYGGGKEACPDQLSPLEFCEVKRLGALGDSSIKSGARAAAQVHWQEALQVYAGRDGCGVQRAIRSRLYSRLAAAALEESQWASARAFASQALDADGTNTKARLRRVRASLELGDADLLDQVYGDIERIRADGATLSTETTERLRALVTSVDRVPSTAE